MSLAIQYKGQISNPTRIEFLRRALLRFAEEVRWGRLDLTGVNDSRILEVIVYPPEQCEPVFFLFDSQGRLQPPDNLETEESREPPWCSVKTHDGPVEAHVQITRLLRHIQRHYIPELAVSDQGSYWETDSIETLRSARREAGLVLETFSIDEADLFDVN